MKKLTFALLAVAAFAANASNTYLLRAASGEACGATAELAVAIADASRNGVPWDKVDAIMQKTHQNFGPRTREASIAVIREAYYSWSAFSDSAVRKLAYTKCMAEVPPAVRADIRAE
jgi:hypothetical protein